MTSIENPVLSQQVIDLVGGIILLIAAYYAIMSRKSSHPEKQKAYSRAVLQLAAVFLVFAYAVYVVWPGSKAWPVQAGEHLYIFFTSIDTVPDRVNGQLTDYYAALLRQIGFATGSGTMFMPGVLGIVESGVRSVGLVVYTVVFALVSLGAQVPSRIMAGIQNAVGDEEI